MIDVRNPMVRNQRPVADVVIVDEDGDEATTVAVDLLTGQATLPGESADDAEEFGPTPGADMFESMRIVTGSKKPEEFGG